MDQDQATEPAPLDEDALRRPEFIGGQAVTLLDGQKWFIPRPMIKLSPLLIDDTLDAEVQTTFGPEFDKLVAAVRNSETSRDEALALFRLGADLLGRNYAIAPADLGRLIRYRVGHPDYNQPLPDLYLVANGYAPKA